MPNGPLSADYSSANWKEEFDRLHAAHQARIRRDGLPPRPSFDERMRLRPTLDRAVLVSRLLLQEPEMVHAIDELRRKPREEPSTPLAEEDEISRFITWFLLKHDTLTNRRSFDLSVWLAFKVRAGIVAEPDSDFAKSMLLNHVFVNQLLNLGPDAPMGPYRFSSP